MRFCWARGTYTFGADGDDDDDDDDDDKIGLIYFPYRKVLNESFQ